MSEHPKITGLAIPRPRATLFFPSGEKTLPKTGGRWEEKKIGDGTGRMLCLLLLPKRLALPFLNRLDVPALKLHSYPSDNTGTVEVLVEEGQADQFCAKVWKRLSLVYLEQNPWSWETVSSRIAEVANVRNLVGDGSTAYPPVFLLNSALLEFLGEGNMSQNNSSEPQASGQVIVFPVGTNQKPAGVQGYNGQATVAGLQDFLEVRIPGKVMMLLPFPVVLMARHEKTVFLRDLFLPNATYSFLVERIHWHKFVDLAMPLFSGVTVHSEIPMYYLHSEIPANLRTK